VHFNIKDGSSALTTVLLMIIIISIVAFGFIILVGQWNQDTANTSNNTGNLTGITVSGNIFNGTNSTLHGLKDIAPNFIWILIIFFFVVFLTLLALALKRH
jgi:hypothetical protein